MSGLSQILEQASRFAQQHLPPEVIEPVVPVTILLLLVGVLVAVLGARLVRPGLAAAFGIGGAVAGGEFACATGLPSPVTVILAALIGGGVGYFLHRLWVGVAAAALTATIALSVFGYFRILPEVETFQPAGTAAGAVGEFAVLEPEEQREYLEQSPEKWAREFWAHVISRRANLNQTLAVVAGLAGLLGLILGTIVTRPTVIVSTSVMGTSLVALGLALLAARLDGELYRSALAHPRLLAGAGAGLLLASLVLQSRLYPRRRVLPPPPQPAAKPTR